MTAAVGDSRLPDRFWQKVAPQPDGCWIWTACRTVNGYGRIGMGGKVLRSHRLIYQVLIAPVPDDLEVDHLCHVRACVNPLHLQVTTHKGNAENRLPTPGRVEGRGVSWNSGHQKWHATAGHNQRQINGGYFDTLEEARAAARALRCSLFTNNLIDSDD